MKPSHLRWCLAWLPALALASGQEPLPQRESNYSLRNEVEISLEKGLAWLQLHQNAAGSWVENGRPAFTALPLAAFLGDPAGKYRTEPRPDFLTKGFTALRAAAKADGSISGHGDENFETSLSLLALLTNNDPKDAAIEKRARVFLIGLQVLGSHDKLLNGGFYPALPTLSAKRPSPNLHSTLVALEAQRAFTTKRQGKQDNARKDCDWSAAARFLSRCQDVRDPDNRGGFADSPTSPKTATAEPSDPPRASGATTCTGLLALIHAGVEKKDVRVAAALEWIKRHYTLEKNPGAKSDGYYEYLSLFARSLAALDIRDLDLPDGRKIDWARDESLKLLDLQNADGSSGRKSSSDEPDNSPTLTTSLALLTLEVLYHRL